MRFPFLHFLQDKKGERKNVSTYAREEGRDEAMIPLFGFVGLPVGVVGAVPVLYVMESKRVGSLLK